MGQIDLFGEPESHKGIVAAAAEPAVRELGNALPPRLRLGTSSWSFPGWSGIVYGGDYPASRLSREGLSAYAQHPLLRTVGVDSGFYNPIAVDKLQAWADQVPADFRFLVKGARQVTSPWQWDKSGRPTGSNRDFLDADFAVSRIIEPLLEAMGDKLGNLLWQFPPMGRELTANPRRFAEALYRFLRKLPAGPRYSVELRDTALLTADFFQALHHGGAMPTFAVHPKLPPFTDQLGRVVTPQTGPLVIRWLLRPDRQYQQAKAEFSPFARLQAEDADSRRHIAKACRAALDEDRDVYVIANNKAEGSSPLSLAKLAADIVAL